MRRFIRIALLGVLVGFIGIGTALPAQSLNPQTWTWVVECRDSNGVNTTETLGTTLPSGIYAVTVEGVCLHTGGTRDWHIGTPCSLPVVGTVPCTTVTTIHNTPGVVCSLVSTAGAYGNACDPSVNTTTCHLTVVVNGQCLLSGTTGLVLHGGSSSGSIGMDAQFSDTFYDDNNGYFVVTAVLTAL